MKDNHQLRDQWVIKKLQSIPSGKKILDAGAGEMRYKKYCHQLQYVSQDFGQYDGGGDGAGLQTGTWDTSKIDIICDIVSIPQPSLSFDIILCTEVFEHIPDPVAALREFDRLLKPGGQLIITAPFCSLTHFAPYHFSTGFNKYFYAHHLKLMGYVDIECTSYGNFFEFLYQEVKRIKSVTNQYTFTKLYWWERAFILFFSTILKRLSSKNKDSEQLLTFGYLVVAVKK